MKYFSYKSAQRDFVVEEILPSWQPSGSWPFGYFLIEKHNQNSTDIVKHLSQELRIPFKHIGIAGYKDKNAITSQRFCIHLNDVRKCWWPNGVNDLIWHLWHVVDISYHEKPLHRGDNIWNKFTLRLRKNDVLNGEQFRDAVRYALHQIEQWWFPNYFGEQRFGINGRNPGIGKRLLFAEKKDRWKLKKNLRWSDAYQESQFKVQALSSQLFNIYLEKRIRKEYLHEILPGDIVSAPWSEVFDIYTGQKEYTHRDITWPSFGDDMMMAMVGKDIYNSEEIQDNASLWLELATLHERWLTPAILQRFKNFNVFGRRRHINAPLKGVSHSFIKKKGDLLLSFTLWSWMYATVVLHTIEQYIDTYLSSLHEQ